MPALQVIFRAMNVEVKNLPPNMTDALQVMDLVVKFHFKAGFAGTDAMPFLSTSYSGR